MRHSVSYILFLNANLVGGLQMSRIDEYLELCWLLTYFIRNPLVFPEL